MGNVIRIVVGVAGLTAAAWAGGRAWRRRRAGADASFRPAWIVLVATAVVMALTAVPTI
ncbi:hypothetical protein [Haloactinopolyspora sp.]|jgi:hypothetical protein|uniref:hypothetical protein n=1 Tax=Haloactinopolyspora sp. TaxID=1966353 RepID=UPI0026276F50|nr:hypothetical protein [Haloactinopolyspora sp.]